MNKREGQQYAYAVQFDDGDFDGAVPQAHIKGMLSQMCSRVREDVMKEGARVRARRRESCIRMRESCIRMRESCIRMEMAARHDVHVGAQVSHVQSRDKRGLY